jgi:hypothetical protein
MRTKITLFEAFHGKFDVVSILLLLCCGFPRLVSAFAVARLSLAV